MRNIGSLRSLLVVAALAAAAVGPGVPGDAAGDVTPPTAPPVPAPPAPLTVAAGTAAEQAAAVAVGTLRPGADGLAAWLAAYDLAGIPVFDEAGASLGATGDDPMGPPFWMVWMLAPADRTSGVRLTDLVGWLADPDGDATAAATVALDQLRAAQATGVPAGVAFVAEFIEARSALGARRVNLFDSATTADDVALDVATAQLVAWMLLRWTVAGSALTAPSPAETTPAGLVADDAPARSPAAAPARPCSETFMEGDAGSWFNWVLARALGGIEIAGVGSLPGFVSRWMEELAPLLASKEALDKFSALSGKINVATGALGVLLQLSAITLANSAEPLPLVRSKTTTPGETTRHSFTLSYDAGQFDGNEAITCTLTYLYSAIGIGVSFPPSGPIVGAEVMLQGGLGFGDRLITAGSFVTMDAAAIKQETDGTGTVYASVTGRGQPVDRSGSNVAWAREYSISAEAQPGAVGGTNIATMFFDGLTVTAGGVPAVASSVIDFVQVVHWDFAEMVFPLTDWRAGYRLDADLGAQSRFTATICDTSQPFRVTYLQPQLGLTGTLTMNPDSTFTYEARGTLGPSSVAGIGSGTWLLSATDTAEPELSITVTELVMDSNFGSVGLGGTLLAPLELIGETENCPGNS